MLPLLLDMDLGEERQRLLLLIGLSFLGFVSFLYSFIWNKKKAHQKVIKNIALACIIHSECVRLLLGYINNKKKCILVSFFAFRS